MQAWTQWSSRPGTLTLSAAWGATALARQEMNLPRRQAVEREMVDGLPMTCFGQAVLAAASTRVARRAGIGAVLVLALGTTACQSDFDLVLEGGTVIDGTGAAGVPADVGVLDGRIAEVGDLSGRSASERLIRAATSTTSTAARATG